MENISGSLSNNRWFCRYWSQYSEWGLQNWAQTSSCNKKAMKKLFNRLEISSEIQMPS